MQSIIWSKDITKVNKQLKTIDNVQIDRNDSRNAFAHKTPPTLKLHNSDLEAINCLINCLPKQQEFKQVKAIPE